MLDFVTSSLDCCSNTFTTTKEQEWQAWIVGFWLEMVVFGGGGGLAEIEGEEGRVEEEREEEEEGWW